MSCSPLQHDGLDPEVLIFRSRRKIQALEGQRRTDFEIVNDALGLFLIVVVERAATVHIQAGIPCSPYKMEVERSDLLTGSLNLVSMIFDLDIISRQTYFEGSAFIHLDRDLLICRRLAMKDISYCSINSLLDEKPTSLR